MVVSKKLIFGPAPLGHFLQEVGQGIGFVKSAAQFILHRGEAAVADDVVHHPARSIRVGPGGLVLILVGQPILPPGQVVHLVHCTPGIQLSVFFLKQWIIRLQNAVLDIVAAGPTHGKEGFSLDILDLAPHQVNH